MIQKICPKCKQLISVASVRVSYCKPCMRDYSKARHAANIQRERARFKTYYYSNLEKERERRLKRKYGITIEGRKALEQKQNSQCAICNVHSDKLVVDHCHETGSVRGLLCSDCNLAIGLMKDNIGSLLSAATYLETANASV
jgi:N12 class adenine-specific DNA methylase